MTREEAVVVLKTLMKNPLFSEVHKVAFNIAIHDIKQRHDWDINNLILINKENYEPQEPIIDKIRAEIEELDGRYVIGDYGIYGENSPKYVGVGEVLAILDKYKKESAPQESEG